MVRVVRKLSGAQISEFDFEILEGRGKKAAGGGKNACIEPSIRYGLTLTLREKYGQI